MEETHQERNPKIKVIPVKTLNCFTFHVICFILLKLQSEQ